jgi:hypothetical protein
MPSYAHYSQTLIPHMPVPPGSIHLHKHSPSVLHLPLWVSTTGQIRKSQSPKLVLDTLWKKPLPNKLSHLERVAHRPDNLPLPTTITSLTWREVTHRLGMDLHWPASHAQSSTAWPQQPTGKTDTGFPNRLNNHEIDSRFWFRDCTKGTEIPRTGSNCSDRGCTGYLRNQHRLFGFQGCTRVFLQRSDRSRSDGRVEWRRNPHHGSSQPFYLHVLGLTLVTHATACIPSARVPSIWKLLVFPKRT